MKEQMKRMCYFRTAIALVLTFTMLMGVSLTWATSWKFGVMSDTQRPNSLDNKKPNVAVNVIRHLNQEFIKHGVKFVLQVGDLTDTPSTNTRYSCPLRPGSLKSGHRLLPAPRQS
jgi:hypothetical protein